LQFKFITLRTWGHFCQQIERVLQMRAGFHKRKPLAGLSARHDPVVDRRFDLARLRVVVSDYLRDCPAQISKITTQCFSSSDVQSAPFGPQQACVGLVLHQRMIERECLAVRPAAAQQEACFEQTINGRKDLLFWEGRNRVQQFQGKFATDDRRDLRDGFHGRRQIQACHQRGVQGIRHGEG
jgi:hypothetical protein